MQEMQQTQVRSLGWEESLGGGNSNPLQYSCRKNPMEEEPGGLQSVGESCVWPPSPRQTEAVPVLGTLATSIRAAPPYSDVASAPFQIQI